MIIESVIGVLFFVCLAYFIALLCILCMKPKPLLVLDMNNVLVCRAYKPKIKDEKPDLVPHVGKAELLGNTYTWKRPALDALLAELFNGYTVAVWTSARRYNASLLAQFVFGDKYRSKLLFEWDQRHCEVESRGDGERPRFLKNVSRIRDKLWPGGKITIVDDSPEKMLNNDPSEVALVDGWTPANDAGNALHILDILLGHGKVR